MPEFRIDYYDFKTESYKVLELNAKDYASAIDKINNRYGKYNIDLCEIRIFKDGGWKYEG